MLADIALRRRDYAEPELFEPRGRYGDVRLVPIGGSSWSAPRSAGAWSPTPRASWLTWQGYLLDPFGLGGKTGAWAFANLGVLVALVVGFLVTLLSSTGSACAAQEARPRLTVPRWSSSTCSTCSATRRAPGSPRGSREIAGA